MILQGWKEKLMTIGFNCIFLAKHIEKEYLSVKEASTFRHSD